MSTQSRTETPLDPDQIADLSPSATPVMDEELIARRLYNLHLMDYTVRKCEYRKHIVAYKPFICHILYGAWRNKPRIDARDEVPYARIDQYAEWGVQIIELHHDVWAHFGRLEPINEAVFSRFVDYCHQKGIQVYVYIVLGQTSLTDPALDPNALAHPLYPIRPPETYHQPRTAYLAPWVQACTVSPAWHRYMLSGVETLFARYKVDGLYIDGGVVWGQRCKHTAKTRPLSHHPRVLDKDVRGVASRTFDQGPVLDDRSIDLVNQICGLAQSYGKGITAYLNDPKRYGNYDLPNRFIDHRLAGEAGDTKAFRYWIDMNRGDAKRAIYQVYAWWDMHTMPPEEPFYACNLPFVQFPFMMQGKFAMGEGWSDEHEALWAHYARIYRELARENTVAYVNVRDATLFRQPLEDEMVVCSLFVREDIYLVVSNLGDRDIDLEFTVPLENVETGAQNVRSVHLKARGSLRIFRVSDPSALEPTLEQDPLSAALEQIEFARCIPDLDNLALEGPVSTGTVGKGFFRNAAGYLMETQANDGNLDTYWSPEFDGPPDTWWYMIELREPGPIEKVQVVTRASEEKAFQLLLTEEDWDRFAEPETLDVQTERQGSKAFVTYLLPPTPARYLKLQFTQAGPLSRVYEVRAYRERGAQIVGEKSFTPIPVVASKAIDEDIDAAQDVALGCQAYTNYPGDVARIVDGDLSTEYVSQLTFCGGGPVWCVLDLGQCYDLAALQYVPGGEGNYHQYYAYLSADLRDWVRVVDESENTEVAPQTGRTYAFAPVRARYVAVRVNYTSAGKGDIPVEIAAIKAREA